MPQKVSLTKQVFDKNQYQKVIDTDFTQLVNNSVSVPTGSNLPSISEFFTYYQDLFFEIPKYGVTDSHEYLIKTSQDYIGSNVVSDEINALIEELTELKQENLELQQNILDLARAAENNNG